MQILRHRLPIAALGLLFAYCGCERRTESVVVAEVQQAPQPAESHTDSPSIIEAQPILDGFDSSPVSATLKMEPQQAKRGDSLTLTVELQIEPLWEVRQLDGPANVPSTRLELQLPVGIDAEPDWQSPPPSRSMSPDRHPVYIDTATFRRQLTIIPTAAEGKQTVKCKLQYQACNDRQCLEPAAVELATTIVIE